MNSGFLDRLKRLGVSPNGKLQFHVVRTESVSMDAARIPRTEVQRASTPPIAGLRRENASWVVDSTSAPHAQHGSIALDFDAEGWPHLAAIASRDPRFRDIPVEDWCFIDTETTSLNSGAGVWVFLVGMGRFCDGSFVVRQHVLAGPEHERSFLEAVGQELSRARAIVTFHGKSFDAPRIDDRFRLMGLGTQCQGVPHLDLIHPVRRMVKSRWPDVRLRSVEEKWLGFFREDDLPGALCPTQFFLWVRGLPHRMNEVFEHNRLDIVSLAALTKVLLAAYAGDTSKGCPIAAGLDFLLASETQLGLARLQQGVDQGSCVDKGLIVRACHAAFMARRLDLAAAFLDRMRTVHPQDVKTPVLERRLLRLVDRISRSSIQG